MTTSITRRREVLSRSAEDTVGTGRRLGARLAGGEVVLLFGQLGAGKTHFVRGLAAGLGLDPAEVRSPSYALIHEHRGRINLYHVDLFRLSTLDLPDLGLEDLYAPTAVVSVEWAERLEEAGWDLGDAIIVEIVEDETDPGVRVITVDEP